jgi:hypothetical protein
MNTFFLGFLVRYALIVIGVDPMLAARCPRRDIAYMLGLALLEGATWAWFVLIYVGAAHIALASDGQFHPDLALLGLFVATMISLSGLFCFMRPSWSRAGEARSRRYLGGLPPLLGTTRGTQVATALRVLLALGESLLSATVVMLWVMGPEIDHQLQQKALIANESITRLAEAQVDEPIAANVAAREGLRTRIATDDRELANLRAAAAAADDAETVQQLALIARLTDAKSAAEQELADAQALASDELAGIPGVNRSGKAGDGPRRRAAQEKIANAAARVTAAADALAAAQDRLAELRRDAAGVADRALAQAQARIGDLMKDRDEAQAELRQLDAEYPKLVAGRAGAVRAAVEANPRYVAVEAGLGARLDALDEVARGHLAKTSLIVGLHLLFFALNLLVVLALNTGGIPLTYTRLLNAEDEIADWRVAEMIAREIGIKLEQTPPPEVEEALSDLSQEEATALAPAEPSPSEQSAIFAIENYAREAERQRKAMAAEEDNEQGPSLGPDVTPATSSQEIAKRGRGRPRGSKTRDRSFHIDGGVQLPGSVANPAGKDGADEHEAEQEKEQV